MNIRYWFWRAFKPNRARGIKAAQTRARNRALESLAQAAGFDSLPDATGYKGEPLDEAAADEYEAADVLAEQNRNYNADIAASLSRRP